MALQLLNTLRGILGQLVRFIVICLYSLMIVVSGLSIHFLLYLKKKKILYILVPFFNVIFVYQLLSTSASVKESIFNDVTP